MSELNGRGGDLCGGECNGEMVHIDETHREISDCVVAQDRLGTTWPSIHFEFAMEFKSGGKLMDDASKISVVTANRMGAREGAWTVFEGRFNGATSGMLDYYDSLTGDESPCEVAQKARGIYRSEGNSPANLAAIKVAEDRWQLDMNHKGFSYGDRARTRNSLSDEYFDAGYSTDRARGALYSMTDTPKRNFPTDRPYRICWEFAICVTCDDGSGKSKILYQVVFERCCPR